MVGHDKGGQQDWCHDLRGQTQGPVCQRLPADPVDQQVVAAFFQALTPVALNRSEQALPQRRQPQADVDRAHQLPRQRPRYEAELARRPTARVAPANRLVADALAHRWEAAWQAWREAEDHGERRRQQPAKGVALVIPRARRRAVHPRGPSWPMVWPQDTRRRRPRKARWRGLLDTGVLHRLTPDTLPTRLVWRGGAGSELDVPSPVRALRDLSGVAELAAQILALEPQGQAAEAMAQLLTPHGGRSPQRRRVLPSTVHTLRLRHGRLPRYRGPRPR